MEIINGLFYISTFEDARQVALDYPIATERVAVGAASAPSSAFTNPGATASNPKPMIARIATDVDCQYIRGTAPTADGTSEPLFAGQVEHVRLKNGDKFAVIEKQV